MYDIFTNSLLPPAAESIRAFDLAMRFFPLLLLVRSTTEHPPFLYLYTYKRTTQHLKYGTYMCIRQNEPHVQVLIYHLSGIFIIFSFYRLFEMEIQA